MVLRRASVSASAAGAMLEPSYGIARVALLAVVTVCEVGSEHPRSCADVPRHEATSTGKPQR